MPIPGDAAQSPINPHGRSKLMVEQILAEYSRAYGLRSSILRYFNAAGADPEAEIGEARAVETHLVPLALDAILGVRPPLKVYGTDHPTPDGTAIRDFIHVSDLADAHVSVLRRLLDTKTSFVADLGTGKEFSVNHVINAIERVTGRRVPREPAPRRAGDPPDLIADPTSSQLTLGLSLRHSELETIIETAWAWHIRQSGRQSARPGQIWSYRGTQMHRSVPNGRRRLGKCCEAEHADASTPNPTG